VLNLLNNAMQALDEVDWPHKEIAVRTWADDRVYLEVADNGPGFDPAVRDRVLEPFFTTKSGSSLGMGLPIVKAIVENADGRLELADAPGGGAVVRVSLPIATPP
ncbi:sensor histidine kinase, partial [Symbiobacterium thermophilum]